jgi:hypothetical protein
MKLAKELKAGYPQFELTCKNSLFTLEMKMDLSDFNGNSNTFKSFMRDMNYVVNDIFNNLIEKFKLDCSVVYPYIELYFKEHRINFEGTKLIIYNKGNLQDIQQDDELEKICRKNGIKFVK